ncbi:MAG: NAD-dependent epimerase/dehydratase family protein [Luteolibacter sp.]
MHAVPRGRVLVTGAAGFIGGHLVEALAAGGWQVTGVDIFDTFYDPSIKRATVAGFPESVTMVEADIRDAARMDRIVADGKFDQVIHLAALAGVRPSIEQPARYVETNINGTLNILEACRKAGVKRLLFASSSSVYGAGQSPPFREAAPISHTLSPYAATKVAGEHLCAVYSHLHGMQTTCLRFFTVYGPRQRPDLAIHKFARLMMEGEEIPMFGDGSSLRDYTFIEDLIDGLLRIVTAEPVSYEIVNLGSGRTISLKEMIDEIAGAFGQDAKIRRLAPRACDMETTHADIRYARERFGYSPRWSFAEGIRKFAEWYRHEEATV